MLDQELLNLLACPVCLGGLEKTRALPGGEGLLCPHCSLIYPVRDDIPIMLKEEAFSAAGIRAGKDDPHGQNGRAAGKT